MSWSNLVVFDILLEERGTLMEHQQARLALNLVTKINRIEITMSALQHDEAVLFYFPRIEIFQLINMS